MSTTVHLPQELLASVDDRARELGLSRNRYIIEALERMLESETRWSAHFIAELETARTDTESRRTLEELVEVVGRNRTSKAPPVL